VVTLGNVVRGEDDR